VLAQNDSEIAVLTAQPFAILFRIPAEKADVARFTPDSREIVFVSGGTRQNLKHISLSKSAAHVQRWNIADQTHVDSPALPMLVCGNEELSPDGTVFVCEDFEGTLRLVKVDSGETLFEQAKFAKEVSWNPPQEWKEAVRMSDLGNAYIDFSPDGHFLVVMSFFGSALAWDLRKRRVPELGGELKRLKHNADMLFGFRAPDRVLTTGPFGHGRRGVWTCKVITFPAGIVQSKPKVPVGRFYQTTDPGFILLRPFGKYAFFRPQSTRSAIAELSTGQVSDGALDVIGRHYVAERVIGKEVGLYEIGKVLQASVVIH
jgi:hypothetical protein